MKNDSRFSPYVAVKKQKQIFSFKLSNYSNPQVVSNYHPMDEIHRKACEPLLQKFRIVDDSFFGISQIISLKPVFYLTANKDYANNQQEPLIGFQKKLYKYLQEMYLSEQRLLNRN